MKLTPKQERFVQEYLVDLNATAAAKRAGYSDKTAYSIGQENLKKPEIQSAIQEAKAAREKRTEITQDMVIQELAKLGFFDIRKLFDENGKPMDITKLDADTSAALVGLDVQDVEDGDGDYIGYVKKYKMADKIRALELLGKHLGIWEPKDKQQTAVSDIFLQSIERELMVQYDGADIIAVIPDIDISALIIGGGTKNDK